MGPHTWPTIPYRQMLWFGTNLEHGRDLAVLDDLYQRGRGPGRPMAMPLSRRTSSTDASNATPRPNASRRDVQRRVEADMGRSTGTMEAPNGSMQPMSLPLALTLMLIGCDPAPMPLAEGLPEAADATSDLVASEEVLLHLGPTLPLLASDLIDGRLPGSASRAVFDSVMEVATSP